MKKLLLLAVAIFSVFSISFSQTINTIAGNGVAGYSGSGGLATAAEITTTGLALDDNDNIYFVNTGYNIVSEVNTSGILTTVIGNGVQGFSGDGGQATLAELD